MQTTVGPWAPVRPPYRRPLRLISALGLMLMLVLGHARPLKAANQPATPDPADQLVNLPLEQLMNMEVTSVAKQAQPLAQAAAAVFVITEEDIRRSGATSIPEALRMAPGIQVARIDAHRWAISSRGFNGEFANKLLVLMDGRTLYTPLFSGVFWDVQDTTLEDIDRIEVIRGPGAALWGANAVNGVINIITKKAKDTQGILAVAGAGTEERGFATLRYGGSLGDDTHFRVYGKHFERDDFVRQDGSGASDSWRNSRAGFRVDSALAARDAVTVQGDYYNGTTGIDFQEALLTPPFSRQILDSQTLKGANLLTRWKHDLTNGSSVVLQAYYDRTERRSPLFGEYRDTIDLDVQHNLVLGDRHHLVWGAGYRGTHDRVFNTPSILLTPTTRYVSLFSGFIQDEITLLPNRVTFTAGTKVEHNDFTGFLVQPSGRLRWTPTNDLTLWGAISRGYRTPSRAEDDARITQQAIPPNGLFPGSPAALTAALGNRGFTNEALSAYELGGRMQVHETLSVDVTGFYNHYDHLRSLEPGSPTLETTPLPPHLLVPFFANNKLSAETRGVEVSAEWRPVEWWRLQTSYTYLHMRMLTGDSLDPLRNRAAGESPQHQVSVRSLMRLPGNLEFDLWGRYVDHLPALGVPGYINLDARLAWKPMKGLEVAVVGQNVLDTHRPEFVSSVVPQNGTEIQRGGYLKVTWRY